MMDIIESLSRISVRENINMALHWGTKPEHMALHIGKSGKVLKVEHREKSPVRVPWPVNRTSGPKPNLLFDSYKYLLQKGKQWDVSREFHMQWVENCPDHDAVSAVKAYFKKGPPSLEITKKQKDLPVIFYWEDTPICEIPELHEAIDQTLRGSYTYVCYPSRFDDSEYCVLDTHGKLSFYGLQNPQALLGFNQDVVRNGGFSDKEKMLHAAMSYETMRCYTGGLEWLRQNRTWPVPSIKSGAFHYLGWTEDPHRIEGLVQKILRGCPKDTPMKEWRQWVQEHLDEDLDLFEDTTRFNILSLACDSRIAVRSFHSLTVAQVAHALVSFLDDFSFPTKEGLCRSMTTPYHLLKFQDPENNPTLTDVERLYDAVFIGKPYARELLTTAIKDYINKVSNDESHVLAEAALNAFTRRRFPHLYTDNHMTTPHPNVLNNPFFIAGRMFGLMEIRNRKAKDPGDSVSITKKFRYYMTNPKQVFPDLFALSETHAQKLKNRRHRYYEMEFSDLMDQMEGSLEGREWPGRTSSEQKIYLIRGRSYQRLLEREAFDRRVEESKKKKSDDSSDDDIPEHGL